MKKMYPVMILLFMALVISGCGGQASNQTQANNSEQGGEGEPKSGQKEVTIKLFNFKTEIVDQLNKLKQDYEQAHPGVTLQVDTVIGTDYASALKGRFAGNEMPDIFVNAGYTELETWIEHLEDLSDQPWVENIVELAKDPISKDGKIYGMPMNLEGYGFIYNKDLFEKASIDVIPTTITELKNVVEQLESAGIPAFATSYQGWVIPGRFGVNVPFAVQEDPVELIASLNAGSANLANNALFHDWVDLIDLELQHSVQNPMTTDYNTQVTLFSNNEVAMIHNGNWIQPMLDSLNPNMNLGIMPMPINDNKEANDKIFAGVPNYWVVNKNSSVKEQAKEFLNWLVSTEAGQNYITKEFKFIPAFKNIEANPEDIGDLAAAIQIYVEQEKAYGWHWLRYPTGVVQEFGATMQKYAAGNLKREQLPAELENVWNKLK